MSERPKTIDAYWAELCICRHERREHSKARGAGGSCARAYCPCDTFDLSEDQTRSYVFVGTVDEVCAAIEALAGEETPHGED